MSGIHQKVKFGDLIYIEIEDKYRYSLSSPGFSLKSKSQIEVNRITIQSSTLNLKDFENNLFVIFPPMSEKFQNNKLVLDERVQSISQKLEYAPNLMSESDSKRDMSVLISTYQETKREVYSNNQDLRENQIGKAVKFGKNFILIHMKSQMLLSSVGMENSSDLEKNKVILAENYSDDCIFQFSPFNRYEKDEFEVFCNQNIYIRKSEKNIWANNPYLYYHDNNIENNNNYKRRMNSANSLFGKMRSMTKNRNDIVYTVKKYSLLFTDEHDKARPFQIKICSKYIDPSSSNLSFSNPFWIVCQSAEKYLIIKPTSSSNNHGANNSINSSLDQSLNNINNNYNDDNDINNIITFAPIERDKTTNNIYGLFNVEQIDHKQSGNGNGNDLIMSPYIKFNKSVRFRHVATKKYLAFIKKEIGPGVIENMKISNYNTVKMKTYGTLQLKDLPDEDCEWLFMESYKIMNREKYEKAKLNGMGPQKKKLLETVKSKAKGLGKKFKNHDFENKMQMDNKNNNEEAFNPNNNTFKIIVKKKDILRIFHIKSEKFLSFEDVIGISDRETEDIKGYKNIEDGEKNMNLHNESYKHNLTLNKLPLDNDLIRLCPCDESKSWEIHLILYFSETLNDLIYKVIKNDFRIIMKNDLSFLAMDRILEVKDEELDNELENDGEFQNRRNLFSKQFKKRASFISNLNPVTRNKSNDTNKDKDLNKKDSVKDVTNKDPEDLRSIVKYWNDLKTCFEALRDFCLNKYNKRYEYTVSSGKPVYYRQVFLQEQGFLEMTLRFLSKAKVYLSAYIEFLRISEQNSLKLAQTLKEKEKEKDKDKDKKKKKEKNSKKVILSSTRTFLTNNAGNTKGAASALKYSNSIFSNPGKPLQGIKSHEEQVTDLFKEMNLTITKSFEFLSAICKSNPANKEYIFSKRDSFWDYILVFKEAAQCLMGIIKDDENYMSEIIQENISKQLQVNKKNIRDDDLPIESKRNNNLIDSIIEYLNDTTTYDMHTLSLLSKLMKSADKGITSNQEHIFKSLIRDKKDKFLIKITPKFNDTIFFVVYRTENEEFEYRNLEKLCNSKSTLSDYDKKVVMYLATQLNLFADMCYGRNYVCIEKIRELFPLDHLIFHISNIDLHEEILVGLINILNYAYIDIAPHSEIIYPSMIKIVNLDLKIERTDKYPIKTFIPLDKLNLILCISLYNLYNINHDKLLVNTSNISLIFNLILFRLYENVEYNVEVNDVNEKGGKHQTASIHNLKEDVKKFIQNREKALKISKGNKKLNSSKFKHEESSFKNSFFKRIGYKFFEYSYDHEIGSEFIIFVLDYINEFFMEKVIIENIDTNTENKTIIAETFKAINNQDLLTQNNMNYLMKIMTQIKQILTCKSSIVKNNENLLIAELISSQKESLHVNNKLILLIIKQISKVIIFIFNIKINDMIDNILENLLYQNKIIIAGVKKNFVSRENMGTGVMFNIAENFNFLNNFINNNNDDKDKEKEKDFNDKEKDSTKNMSSNVIKAFEMCIDEFQRRKIFKEIFLDKEFYLYQVYDKLNIEENNSTVKEYIDSVSNYDDNKDVKENKLKENNEIIKMQNSNFEIEYLNSTSFKTLQELIIKMLEVNVDETMMKILIKLFKIINSQRIEIIDYIKKIKIIYKQNDLDKYRLCSKLIKDLSLLTEKTEIWMQPDQFKKVNLNLNRDIIGNVIKNMNLENLIKMEPEHENDFERVKNILMRLNNMFYKKSAINSYKSKDKVELAQTILFSLQLDNVLFALLREICQVYPNNIKENKEFNSPKKNQRHNRPINTINPLLIFRDELNNLIKNIFKLLKSMVYDSKNFQEMLQGQFLNLKTYDFLYNLGYLKLLREIVGINSKFALENGQFIIDIIKRECSVKNFEDVITKFIIIENFTNSNNNKNETEQKEQQLPNFKYRERDRDSVNNILSNIKRQNNYKSVLNRLIKNKSNKYFNSSDQKNSYNKIKQINLQIDKKKFESDLDKICKILKLVNKFIICIKEEKFLSPILRLYEEILKTLAGPDSLFKLVINEDVNKKLKKVLGKKMKILGLLIQIGYNFIQINEKLKGLVKKLIPIKILEENLLKLELNIDIEKLVLNIVAKNPLIKDDNTKSEIPSEDMHSNISSTTNKNQFYILSLLKNYYKLKYFSSLLLLSTSYTIERLRDPEKIKFYFNILEKDIIKYKELKKALKSLPSDKRFVNIFKKQAFKYFFKGMFNIIYHLTNLIKPNIFKTYSEGEIYLDELLEVMKNFRYVFKDLIKESKEIFFKSIISYIIKERMRFKELFSEFQISLVNSGNSNGYKIDKLVEKRNFELNLISNESYHGNVNGNRNGFDSGFINSLGLKGVNNTNNFKMNELNRNKTFKNLDNNNDFNDKEKHRDINIIENNLDEKANINDNELNQFNNFNEYDNINNNNLIPRPQSLSIEKELDLSYIIAFTEDFATNIENFTETKLFIERETKILAKNLKSKINFHHAVYYYINNNSSLNNYIQPSFHLLNIFLKFIQENYLSLKKYPEITFLIGLSAQFIKANPQFLREYDDEGNTQAYNFYFDVKLEEIDEVCMRYCQNLFLNNGSVEVLLKIICEGNQKFNQNLFPTILNFFNMVLQQGNLMTQEKFFELFNSFNNSDNLFFYLKQIFNLDIYLFLKNDVTINDEKSDSYYNNLIKNQLSFLQSLTENHYSNLQIFLREQSSNKVSYNFITIIVDYMNMLLSKMSIIYDKFGLEKYVTHLYFNRLISCLETLCEFLQGPCVINQENILNSKIIEIFDKILRETEFTEVRGRIIKSSNNNFDRDGNEKNKDEENNLDINENISFDSDNYDDAGNDDNYRESQASKATKHTLNRRKKTSIQNKLFHNLTDFEKSIMIYKIGLVLLAIIEGRRSKDEIIQKLMRDFDYKLLYEKLTELYYKIRSLNKSEIEFFTYTLYNKKDINKNTLDKKIVIEAGFNIYVFLSSLYSFENSDTEFKRLYTMLNRKYSKFGYSHVDNDNVFDSNLNLLSLRKAMMFYKDNCLRIEVLKDDIVQTVYFLKLTFFKNLNNEMIKNFREHANRSSVQTKLISILTAKEDFYNTLKQIHQLELVIKKLGPLKYLFMYSNFFLFLSVTLGIIMNILILLGFSTDVSGGRENIDVLKRVNLFGLTQDTSTAILRIIGIILICCSGLVFAEFLTRKAPLLYRKTITSHFKDLYDKKTKAMTDYEIKKFSHIINDSDFSDKYRKFQIYFKIIINAEVFYASGYLAFAILALSVHYFFFTYHLIEFIKSQSVLRNVLKAVYNPRKQLVFIFLFFFMFEYFYTLIVFYFFYDQMPGTTCSSTLICLATVYIQTFTSSGNLGNFIDNNKHRNNAGDYSRYILDISFNIIMVWLVFQMISGLIVDTFSSLRKEQEEFDEDSKNVCFICGLERETIEKYYTGKDGFDRHLDDHNVASYFCYIFYLKDKKTSELTGLETYVKDLIDVENISWIPTERCLKMDVWNKNRKNQ